MIRHLSHGPQHLTRMHPRGCNYRLELSSDPPNLRSTVPAPPAFASAPWHLAVPSAAHLPGRRSTLPRRPSGGFSPLRTGQDGPSYLGVRVRVAQSLRIAGVIGSNGVFSPPERPTFAAPARLGARGFGDGWPTDWRSASLPVIGIHGFQGTSQSDHVVAWSNFQNNTIKEAPSPWSPSLSCVSFFRAVGFRLSRGSKSDPVSLVLAHAPPWETGLIELSSI